MNKIGGTFVGLLELGLGGKDSHDIQRQKKLACEREVDNAGGSSRRLNRHNI